MLINLANYCNKVTGWIQQYKQYTKLYYMALLSDIELFCLTKFVKGGLLHTSTFTTLKLHNFVLTWDNYLKFHHCLRYVRALCCVNFQFTAYTHLELSIVEVNALAEDPFRKSDHIYSGVFFNIDKTCPTLNQKHC